MKKSSLILLPLTLLVLSSCTVGNLSFGFVDSGDEDDIDTGDKVIEYYEGDEFSESSYTNRITIDLSNTNADEGTDINLTNADILALLNAHSTDFVSVTSFVNVSSGIGGIKIGASLERTNGSLIASVRDSILVKAVKLTAFARYTSVYDYEKSEYMTIIDDAAISMNDSKYIKLPTSTAGEEKVCSYVFSEAKNDLNFEVYGKRAVLKTLDLFY